MPVNQTESFIRFSNYFYTILEQVDNLYKKGGDDTKKGINLLDENWLKIKKTHSNAVKLSSSNNFAARMCIKYANIAVHGLAAILDIDTQIFWYNEGLKASKRLGDEEDISVMSNNLAISLIKAKKPKEAIELINRNLEVCRKTKNRASEGNALGNLGIAYKNLGEYSKAFECQQLKLEISRELNDPKGEMNALGNLGNIYRYLGQFEEGIKCHLLRYELAEKYKDLAAKSRALGDLGIIYRFQGELDKSIDYLERQFDLTENIYYLAGKGNALWELSKSLYEAGRINGAIFNAKEALKIKLELSDPVVSEISSTLLEWSKKW